MGFLLGLVQGFTGGGPRTLREKEVSKYIQTKLLPFLISLLCGGALVRSAASAFYFCRETPLNYKKVGGALSCLAGVNPPPPPRKSVRRRWAPGTFQVGWSCAFRFATFPRLFYFCLLKPGHGSFAKGATDSARYLPVGAIFHDHQWEIIGMQAIGSMG